MKFTKMFKKTMAMMTVCSMMLIGCSSNTPTTTTTTETTATEDEGNWAIYMYVCGSNLESDDGAATANLNNFLTSNVTDDTTLFVQTGGTTKWKNDQMDATKTQRWTMEDGTLKLVDEQDLENMSDSNTFAEFLDYANTNYPAEHTMVLLWNHGGGTLGGCCNDDNFKEDSLTLTEMHDAFDKVYDLSSTNAPIDILGFDCCLMATIDVADTFKDTAHYLVASEEVEPGDGWNYAEIGNTLGKTPTMTPHDLGVTICDTYYAGLEELDEAAESTLSLTDLTKIDELTKAFSSYTDQMLINAYNDTGFFRDYATFAKTAENYGGNSRVEGYYDLVDIKNFIENMTDEVDTADDVLNALNDCVVYSVKGSYRNNGGGLSFYFDFDGSEEDNEKYVKYGSIDALKALYTFGVSDKVDKEQANYMEQLGLDSSSLPELKTFVNYDFDGAEVQYNKEGKVYADFGDEVASCVIDAYYYLYYMDGDDIYYIGSDDEVNGDLATGIVTEDMGCKWGFLDGNLVCMDLVYDCDDYNLYSVPIKVDGEYLYLQVLYDFTTKTWEILGTRSPEGSSALSSRAIYLEDGTEVTLVQEKFIDGELTEVDGPTFTYSSDTSFEYETLQDGEYAMKFVLEDIYSYTTVSEIAYFDVQNGKIAFDL